ncbi:MAG: MFS transporter [Planctomycetota bacterium]
MANLSIPVACAGSFALGVIFAIIGAVKLRLADRLDIDDEKAGSLISALMFCSLVVVLIIGPLRDMLGFRPIAILGFAAGGICLWLLSTARSYPTALVACLLLGVGAMCANTTGNTLGPTVLKKYMAEAAALNLINVCYGLGAFFTPLLVSYFIKKLDFKKALGIMGAIVFVPIIPAIFSSYPQASQGFQLSESVALLADPVVLLAGLSLLCYIGLEASMGGFVTTYLRDLGYEEDAAGKLLSGFWISLMIARVVTGLLLWQTGAGDGVTSSMVIILAVVAVVAIVMMVRAETKKAGAVATIVTGLSFGYIFPGLIGVTYSKTAAIENEITGSVFGIIFAMGLVGAVGVPYFIGRYSARSSIRQSLRIAVGVAGGLVILSGVLWALPGAGA